MASSSLDPIRRSSTSVSPRLVAKLHFPPFSTSGTGNGQASSPTPTVASCRFLGSITTSSFSCASSANLARSLLSWISSPELTSAEPFAPKIAISAGTSWLPAATTSASAAWRGEEKDLGGGAARELAAIPKTVEAIKILSFVIKCLLVIAGHRPGHRPVHRPVHHLHLARPDSMLPANRFPEHGRLHRPRLQRRFHPERERQTGYRRPLRLLPDLCSKPMAPRFRARGHCSLDRHGLRPMSLHYLGPWSRHPPHRGSSSRRRPHHVAVLPHRSYRRTSWQSLDRRKARHRGAGRCVASSTARRPFGCCSSCCCDSRRCCCC